MRRWPYSGVRKQTPIRFPAVTLQLHPSVTLGCVGGNGLDFRKLWYLLHEEEES